ncbi:MAG: hypothetical protein GXO37_00170 [Chloroflexi bacterium]|nr:hypothetical protein [Chloroflexota bacterium]
MLRCTYCGAPLNISRKVAQAALQAMDEQGLEHFDYPCPRCRKVNKIPRKALARFAPRRGEGESGSAQA